MPLGQRRELAAYSGIVVAIFLAVVALSLFMQKPISWNEGKGWDGVQYFAVAEELAHGHRPSAESPFVYRLGTPFLVSLFPDKLEGFKVVNLIGAGLATFLLAIWLRLWLKSTWLMVAFVFLFTTYWLGPVRFSTYYPAYGDPWLFVFLIAGLIYLAKLRPSPSLPEIVPLALITFVAVLFREFALVIGLAAVFKSNPLHQRRIEARYLLPLAAGLVAMGLTHALATPTNDYSFLRTAVNFLETKLPPTYALGWFVTFGALLVLPFTQWRRSASFLAGHEYLLVFLLACAAVGYVGGGDTERLLYWSAPVVFVLAGKVIEEGHRRFDPVLATVVILSLAFTQRLLWTTPDFPSSHTSSLEVLTILSSNAQLDDLTSSTARSAIRLVDMAEYGALAAFILVWPWLRKTVLTGRQADVRRLNTAQSSGNDHQA